MVGLVDPNPAQPKTPEKQSESWLSSAFSNPVQVMRPAKGKFSPKTDERCITWCSQTARGRTEGQDPWCRSLCIRRVFEHEVRQLTSHFSHDSAHHSRSSSGKSNEPVLKYPLPPEGQPSPHEDDDGDSDFASSSTSTNPYSHSLVRNRMPAGPETRYWQEGWYIWMTKNRWAAQEKIDLMMFDLEKQTQWQKSKEQDVQTWAMEDEERRRARVGVTGLGEPTVEEREEQEKEDELFRTTYLNAAQESFLVRIPTRIPIGMYTQQTFAPTWKVLSIVHESFTSGAQQELARRAWDAALEGAPFRLVKNVFKTCIESFKGGSNGDSQQ